MVSRSVLRMIWAACAMGAAFGTAIGDAATWNGPANGDWFEAANWLPTGVPGNGVDVEIGAAQTVVLSNDTAALNSINLSGTLTFTNWNTVLTATDMWIRNGATVTHTANTDTNAADGWTPDANVYIACTNLLLESGGAIDVNVKGYAGGALGSTVSSAGRGPGGGISGSRSGGGYGGLGGRGSPSATLRGPTYGDAAMPVDPGSGGNAYSTSTYPGGGGGGAVRIHANGAVTVNGTITANGGIGANNGVAGAGSAGSIYITCRTLAGTNGMIAANGGINFRTDYAGGGGGGRVAVIYNPAAQALVPKPAITFSANQGFGYNRAGTPADFARPGTIYFPDHAVISLDRLQGGWVLPAFTTLSVDSLNVSGGTAIFTNDFQLTVTNDLTLSGKGMIEATDMALDVGRDLIFNSGGLYMRSTPDHVIVATIGRDLKMIKNGDWYIYSGLGAPGLDYGALVTVGGNAFVATNSWIHPASHTTNGASPLFHFQNLHIATAEAGFNASGLGYDGSHNSATTPKGFGPGGGLNTGAYGGGGGYGGNGGDGKGAGSDGGATYGSETAPDQPGSGGGAYLSTYFGGAGGGLIRVEVAEVVTLDGWLRSDGFTGGNNGVGGSGSGGGIHLRCRTLAGDNASLSVKGGSNGRSDYGGAGGGGRIGIWYRHILANTGAWSIAVDGGTMVGTSGASAGFPGTQTFNQIPPSGTIVLLR